MHVAKKNDDASLNVSISNNYCLFYLCIKIVSNSSESSLFNVCFSPNILQYELIAYFWYGAFDNNNN